MAVYSIAFLIPFLAALSPRKLNKNLSNHLWKVYLFSLFLFIGTRYQVGGDWLNFIHFFYVDSKDFNMFDFNSVRSEYGYEFLCYILYNLGLPFYFINIIAAAIFLYGLNEFAKKQPDKWLVFMMATTFLIIVVSMGYTRQSMGIGFLLIALNHFFDGKKIIPMMLIFLGSSFHFSCIFFLTIFILDFKFNLNNLLIWFFLLLVFIFVLIYVNENVARLIRYYYAATDDSKQLINQSKGALVRLSINLVAAFIYLFTYKKLTINKLERRFYLYISILVIVSVFLVQSNSTLVDRVNIYFMPIQFFVFTRIIYFFSNINKSFLIFCTGCFYYLLLWGWLIYGTYSYIWLPYNSLILPHTSKYTCNDDDEYWVWENLRIDSDILCKY